MEAYEAAIAGLENTIYKWKLGEFRDDHRRHIKELSKLLVNHGYVVPKGSSP